jgi:putative ATP-dependent endonuclease of OLD family
MTDAVGSDSESAAMTAEGNESTEQGDHANHAMHVSDVRVRNFRLLKDVTVSFDEQSTVIVGRNNSGKTSLTELFRRLLGDDRVPSFQLEDFSLSCHDDFWKAFQLLLAGKGPEDVRRKLPLIEVRVTVSYDDSAADLGPLGNFVIDLSEDSHEVVILIQYQLDEGRIPAFFADLAADAAIPLARQRSDFFRAMKERIPQYFKATLKAVDPTDESNTALLEPFSLLTSVLRGGFITAQRGLDDTTSRENDVLGKILESLFRTASGERADPADRKTVEALDAAIKTVQASIDSDFAKHLSDLLPTLELFGYPGLTGPGLRTETDVKIESLLSNHTRIRYEGADGVNLPESYNGLGMRNLIYILFRLLEFFKSYQAEPVAQCMQLVFIEEPEAHLHPQMQEVFIRQLSAVVGIFAKTFEHSLPWPVHFVVTTHSSHVANAAPFPAIRYFLTRSKGEAASTCETVVKDLSKGLSEVPEHNRNFLHKYMTLTRCDLMFADKALLIEGAAERLLLPEMIRKVDAERGEKEPKLSTQYISVVEVGGAYAHLFFDLLKFLELRTLVITDIDSADDDGKACPVSQGTCTTNACIKACFKGEDLSLASLIKKSDHEKTALNRRVVYQVPESDGAPCGRSFEDAFILANQDLFGLTGSARDKEKAAATKARACKKTDFAIEYAIDKPDWVVPRYIAEGLRWLTEPPICTAGAEPPSDPSDTGDTGDEGAAVTEIHVSTVEKLTDAEEAGRKALAAVRDCIDKRQCFLLEAGAGAGKTYSLVHSLRYLIDKEGDRLVRSGRRIACITYTNVARNEIESQTDGHRAVLSATIHSFYWSLIRRFQPALRDELPKLPKWPERLQESGEIGARSIDYDLGYPSAKDPDRVLLGHDDVLALAVALMARPKFRALLTDRYPVIFIDEYQDTDKGVMEALKTYFLGSESGPLIGLFGDHWQKIYKTGCGQVVHPRLHPIDKHANFRSVGVVVEALNKMRPKLPQYSSRPRGSGSVRVYHSNEWRGQRQTRPPWKGDLPTEEAHAHLEAMCKQLAQEGWDFDLGQTKILMLTHSVLARQQGYSQLAKVFPRNEMFIKKEDARMAFFVDVLEPVCEAYSDGRFGEMFRVLGGRLPAVRSHADKLKWRKDMADLLKLRDEGTIGDVLDLLRKTKHPRLPEAVEHDESELTRLSAQPEEDWPHWASRLRQLRSVPYREVELAARFINESTPFSTKHGVKGAQFDNVLVVVGRGWSDYDFDQMLALAGGSIPADKQAAFERARNLFYVCCSRSRANLAVLFTQELSAAALATLAEWFGADNVSPLAI